MPELPEVETIVRYLRPRMRGKRLLGLWTDTPRLFRGGQKPPGILKLLKGRTILDVRRVGKNIVLVFPGEHDLYLHLMMTGKLLWNLGKNEPHTSPVRKMLSNGVRAIFKLSGGNTLAFQDVRKFGRIRLLEKSADQTLGPDALSLSFKGLKDLISEKRGTVKNFLMNQKIIAGVGNIYSDEILWYAGINPAREASGLKEKEIRGIFNALRRVLGLAVKKGGTSARDYRKPDGEDGGYYRIRKVYQREGEKCPKDGAIIKRIVINQRSAHYCPGHQK